MKTRIFLGMAIASLFLLVLFSGCSSKRQVGLLMDSFAQERWAKDKQIFEKRIGELSGQLLFDTANGNPDRQFEQARKLLESGVDVLVIVPVDQYQAGKIVKLAHKHGVPVISYDRLIRNCDLDFYISFDNLEIGQLQAEYLTRVCPKGKYAIISGPTSDHNSMMIKTGQLNVLGPYIDRGDIRVVFDRFVSRWDKEEGYKLMKECLKQNPDINAVLVANDDLATGVVNALEEKNLAGKVWVSGQDADRLACERIMAGKQVMTVYKPIDNLATSAAELAMKVAQKSAVPSLNMSINNGMYMVPALLLQPYVVNKETIKLTIVPDSTIK
ncbi:MAG: sugar ABC transporter substrate-binding protein [Bacteroidales bacterium]|nr:sugar ABC transporter substrate-binding protein [Bacteroidales bacterium]